MLLSLLWNPSLSLSGNRGWMLVGRHPPSLISTSLTPVQLLLEFKKQPPNTMTPPKQKTLPNLLGERASKDAKSSSQFSCSKAENNRAHTWHKSAVAIQFLSEIINTRMFQILAQKKTNHFVWQMKSSLTKEPLACLTRNGPSHSHMTTAGYVGGGLGTPIWIPNLCLLQLWMCHLELARITHYHPAFATTHRES
jgi:hypothetical protein